VHVVVVGDPAHVAREEKNFPNGDCFCYCYCLGNVTTTTHDQLIDQSADFLPWRARSCMHDSVDLAKRKNVPKTVTLTAKFLRNLVGFELELTSFQLLTWPLLFRSRVERRDFTYDRAMVCS
jgi:hypothetical protein